MTTQTQKSQASTSHAPSLAEVAARIEGEWQSLQGGQAEHIRRLANCIHAAVEFGGLPRELEQDYIAQVHSHVQRVPKQVLAALTTLSTLAAVRRMPITPGTWPRIADDLLMLAVKIDAGASGEALASTPIRHAALRDALECDSETFRRYAGTIGLSLPSRGKSNLTYSMTEAMRLAMHMAENAAQKKHREAASNWIAKSEMNPQTIR